MIIYIYIYIYIRLKGVDIEYVMMHPNFGSIKIKFYYFIIVSYFSYYPVTPRSLYPCLYIPPVNDHHYNILDEYSIISNDSLPTR